MIVETYFLVYLVLKPLLNFQLLWCFKGPNPKFSKYTVTKKILLIWP
jgi:hypothetical protein